MQIAVIGAGRMGRIRVEDLANDPRVSSILLTNRNTERAVTVADEFGAAVVGWGDDALLAADAFVVTTGTDTHLEQLSRLTPLGRPILCEKPIALTLADTAAAMTQAEHHGAPLQIGFQRRFDAGLADLHDLIADGGLGTLYSLVLTAHDHQPSSREFIGGSGGIFRDMHVHDFDQIRWLTGEEIAWVHATSAVREHEQYAEFDDADCTAIVGATTGGASFTITGARHDPRGQDVRLEVFGSRDSAASGLTRRTPLHLLPPKESTGPLLMDARPYDGFVDRFREAFRTETESFVAFSNGHISNPCPPESALESLRVAVACEESIRTGRPIPVTDISTSDH